MVPGIHGIQNQSVLLLSAPGRRCLAAVRGQLPEHFPLHLKTKHRFRICDPPADFFRLRTIRGLHRDYPLTGRRQKQFRRQGTEEKCRRIIATDTAVAACAADPQTVQPGFCQNDPVIAALLQLTQPRIYVAADILTYYILPQLSGQKLPPPAAAADPKRRAAVGLLLRHPPLLWNHQHVPHVRSGQHGRNGQAAGQRHGQILG